LEIRRIIKFVQTDSIARIPTKLLPQMGIDHDDELTQMFLGLSRVAVNDRWQSEASDGLACGWRKDALPIVRPSLVTWTHRRLEQSGCVEAE
jgi:hypothetical protein